MHLGHIMIQIVYSARTFEMLTETDIAITTDMFLTGNSLSCFVIFLLEKCSQVDLE